MQVKESTITHLEYAMRTYRHSKAYLITSDCLLLHFYPAHGNRCQQLERMSLRTLIELGAKNLSELSYMSDRKLNCLVDVFEELHKIYSLSQTDNGSDQSKFIPQTTNPKETIIYDLEDQEPTNCRFAPEAVRVLQQLDQLIAALQALSQRYNLSGYYVSDFWPPDFSQSRALSSKSLASICTLRPTDLLQQRGVGIKKAQGLLQALSNFLATPGHPKSPPPTHP